MMQFWISVFGITASIAAGNPFRLPVQATKISCTSWFLRLISKDVQNLALSFSIIHMSKSSFLLSRLMPMEKYINFYNLSFATDMAVDCIEKHHCVYRLQMLLPLFRNGKDLVRDSALCRIRDVYAVDISKMCLNVSHCHGPGVHR